MSQMSGAGAHTIAMTLSVPARGELRIVADDLVARIAEHFGAGVAGAGAALEKVASDVAPPDSDEDISFAFRTEDRDLLITARCGDRSSEVRYRLTA
jgi:hypothetical protein